MEEAATIGSAPATGLRTGGSGSEINVVAAAVMVLSIIPVYFAQRLTSGAGAGAAASRAN